MYITESFQKVTCDYYLGIQNTARVQEGGRERMQMNAQGQSDPSVRLGVLPPLL